MTYAIEIDGAPVEVREGQAFTDAAGNIHPSTWAQTWGQAEMDAAGLLYGADPAVPEGERVASRALRIEGGQLFVDVTFQPLPVVVPDEVAMHKVEKAALLTPWPGHANMHEAIEAGINRLPSPQRELAMIEWKRALNLVRFGLTTIAVMGLMEPPMSEAQRDELLLFADSLA